jgi:hypothetical protein
MHCQHAVGYLDTLNSSINDEVSIMRKILRWEGEGFHAGDEMIMMCLQIKVVLLGSRVLQARRYALGLETLERGVLAAC